MHRLMIGLLLAGVAPAATLENDRLRVVFDDAHGTITSFVDKATGRDFVRAEGSGLYALTLWDANRARVSLTERDAPAGVTVRGRSAVITSTNAERQITVRVECSLAGAALECGLAVKNASPLALYSVRFPAVEFPVRLGESAEDDRLLQKCTK